MYRKLFLASLLSLFATVSVAKAESIFTTIFNVFESKRSETLLVLSGSDGRVYRMSNSKENLEMMKALVGQVVRLDFQSTGTKLYLTQVAHVTSREVDPKVWDLNHFRYNELRKFAPTDLQTYENAELAFNDMMNDGEKNRSQCFKRAHMWAYDMWSKMGVVSQKIYIFYTKRFQIIEEFDWWFHVAPVVTASGVDYVMDGAFMKKPVTIEEWKNFFIRSDKLNCAYINKYQEYEGQQWNRLCFLMKVPMYYFRPADIENRDKKGVKKNNWELEELQDARRAFKGWEETYEGLDNGEKTVTH